MYDNCYSLIITEDNKHTQLNTQALIFQLDLKPSLTAVVISSAAVYHDRHQHLLWHRRDFGQTHEWTRRHDQLEGPALVRVAAFKCSKHIQLTASK